MPKLYCPKTGNEVFVGRHQVDAFKAHGYTTSLTSEVSAKIAEAKIAEAKAAEAKAAEAAKVDANKASK